MNTVLSCLRIRSLEKWLFALAGCALTASALADSTYFEYDARGRLKSTTNANGTVTTYLLDAAGNRVSVVTAEIAEPGQPEAISTIDATVSGQLSITDANQP
jgi:YD repeat-containing protein